MTTNYFYPALFHIAEEGGFWISFPDIPECLTQGENMEQAYEMAVDALSINEQNYKVIRHILSFVMYFPTVPHLAGLCLGGGTAE